jgi:hypothetical protein
MFAVQNVRIGSHVRLCLVWALTCLIVFGFAGGGS